MLIQNSRKLFIDKISNIFEKFHITNISNHDFKCLFLYMTNTVLVKNHLTLQRLILYTGMRNVTLYPKSSSRLAEFTI